MRLRPFATVRARTVLGGSLALGIALLLSASTAGGLLRRSLIRSIDEVAEVRAAEVAVLPVGEPLPAGLASGGGEIAQVVSGDRRVLAASRPVRTVPERTSPAQCAVTCVPLFPCASLLLTYQTRPARLRLTDAFDAVGEPVPPVSETAV